MEGMALMSESQFPMTFLQAKDKQHSGTIIDLIVNLYFFINERFQLLTFRFGLRPFNLVK